MNTFHMLVAFLYVNVVWLACIGTGSICSIANKSVRSCNDIPTSIIICRLDLALFAFFSVDFLALSKEYSNVWQHAYRP